MAYKFPAPVSHINGIPVREYEIVYRRPHCATEVTVMVALSPESATEIIEDSERAKVISVRDVGPGFA